MKNMNFDALSRFLKSLEENRLPSCEMTVFCGGREVFAYKKADLPRYLAYSLTKPVTCALALKLFERGEFTLDDRLSDFIPEFRDMTVSETLPSGEKRLRPAKRDILLRDLFTMTAGFSYDVGALKQANTLEAVKGLSERPLLFDPGAHWNYSLCHDVLGAVIEVITGKKLRTALKDEITRPLGMKNTCFLGETDGDISPLYDAKTGRQLPSDRRFTPSNDYDSGGAGLVTTLYDYAAFTDALLNGGIVGKHTFTLMTEDFLTDINRADFNWPQVRGYGYGLGVRTLVNRAAAGSPSPLKEAGWGGVSGTYSLMDAQNGISAVFMTHVLGTSETYLFPRLRNILYSCI